MSASINRHTVTFETLNALEIITVQREYQRRFSMGMAGTNGRDAYLTRLYSIRAELFPAKRYPGEPK